MNRTVTLRALLTAVVAVPLLATTGCGGGSDAPQPEPPPFLELTTFQGAVFAIGQTTLTDNVPGTSASTLRAPSGPVAEGSLFVNDFVNHRVLGFLATPAANGPTADFVLGQADLNSAVSGESATAFDRPTSIAVAGGRLFVSDWNNDRVLLWNALPSATATPADVVIGQAAFTGGAPGTLPDRMRGPVGIAVAGEVLVVADQLNNRVLIWNAIPAANGAPASLVLGQPDFTSSTAAAGATGMSNPTDVWTDGQRLAVSDEGQNRVLIWNTFPTANQQPADVVVGQADFTATASGMGPARMNGPRGVTSNGTQLFVADTRNNRVLIFDAFPTADGDAATKVLGQGDFVHVTPNDDDQDGTAEPLPTARTLQEPSGVHLGADDRLYVTDDLNNRVVVFQGS